MGKQRRNAVGIYSYPSETQRRNNAGQRNRHTNCATDWMTEKSLFDRRQEQEILSSEKRPDHLWVPSSLLSNEAVPEGKYAGPRSWPLMSIQCRSKKRMALKLHSAAYLHVSTNKFISLPQGNYNCCIIIMFPTTTEFLCRRLGTTGIYKLMDLSEDTLQKMQTCLLKDWRQLPNICLP